MAGRLADRVAFVTAVGDLPGDALVRGLAAKGALVVANHLKPEVAARAAGLAEQRGSRGLAVSANLLDRNSVEDAVAAAIARFGRVDVLVANATWFIPNDPFASGEAEWTRIVERNLRAQIHAVEAVIPHMRARGYGKLVIMASVAGQMGMPGYTYYCAAKAGEIGYMRALARELGPFGIRVNAIAPGGVDLFNYDEATKARIATQLPVGRTGTVDELAAMTVYFASEESDFVTGQVLRLDGGLINA
ncbi:MAG: SDR family oxidoreductase [Chloroflexi bacterium]|nr:SDR family oxidoreductase [Chloroflexota bacterium]